MTIAVHQERAFEQFGPKWKIGSLLRIAYRLQVLATGLSQDGALELAEELNEAGIRCAGIFHEYQSILDRLDFELGQLGWLRQRLGQGCDQLSLERLGSVTRADPS